MARLWSLLLVTCYLSRDVISDQNGALLSHKMAAEYEADQLDATLKDVYTRKSLLEMLKTLLKNSYQNTYNVLFDNVHKQAPLLQDGGRFILHPRTTRSIAVYGNPNNLENNEHKGTSLKQSMAPPSVQSDDILYYLNKVHGTQMAPLWLQLWEMSNTDWEGKSVAETTKTSSSSPWGEKRNSDKSRTVPENDEPDVKRMKFYSWGGKRASEDDVSALEELDKRMKGKKVRFHSWGGKRNNMESPYDEDYDKRGRFYSWGGKRASPGELYSDAGILEDKRNSDSNPSVVLRVPFHAWGGKRDPDQAYNDWIDNTIPEPSFPYYPEYESYDDDEYDVNKRKFYSWGGKRANIQTVKKIKQKNKNIRRAAFYHWGGKRNDM